MPDLDQRVAGGLRELVGRAPIDADVWPATQRYVAKHRRHRHAIAGAVAAVALVAAGLVSISVLRGEESKTVLGSHPTPTTEPDVGIVPLTAVGTSKGNLIITALPSLRFAPATLKATTGVYEITLVDGGDVVATLRFDDPSVRFRELVVNTTGQRKSTRACFGAPGTYTFYDSIPGHRAAGQQGTVHVTGPRRICSQD